MSLETARQQIVTAVEAAKLTYVSTPPLLVEYDNRHNLDAYQGRTSYLCVDIQFLDSYQGDLGPTPFHRHIGAIMLEANVKEGYGTAEGLKILDHFGGLLHGRQFGIVRTMYFDSRPSSTKAGWHICRVAVPFWFDVVVSVP